jgi:hypothetical protein
MNDKAFHRLLVIHHRRSRVHIDSLLNLAAHGQAHTIHLSGHCEGYAGKLMLAAMRRVVLTSRTTSSDIQVNDGTITDLALCTGLIRIGTEIMNQ